MCEYMQILIDLFAFKSDLHKGMHKIGRYGIFTSCICKKCVFKEDFGEDVHPEPYGS